MAGMFDDLVPNKSGGMFDDLLPQAGQRSRQSGAGQDALINVGASVNRALGSLADLAGTDNAASEFFRGNAETLDNQLSQDSVDRQTADAAELAATEGFGNKFITAAKQAAASPLQSGAKALGFMLPTIATAGAGAVAGLGARGLTALNATVGAGMGAGAVKGGIYETVLATPEADLLQDPSYASMRKTMTEAEARQAFGVEAQSYAENGGKIAIGAGVGALTGLTGAEAGVASSLTKSQAKAALTKSAALSTIPKVAAVEALTEVPQEMLETSLGNTGAASGGANINPLTGVAEAGGQALVVGPMAGGFGGAMQVSSARRQLGMNPPAAIDGNTVLDAETKAPVLGLPAPVVRVDGQGNAVMDGQPVPVMDEPGARVAGRVTDPAAPAQPELPALGYNPAQRASPTPIVVDPSGQATTDSQVVPNDITVEPAARKVGRADLGEIRQALREELPALGYDLTPRASQTPIAVDGNGNATTDAQVKPNDLTIEPAARVVGRSDLGEIRNAVQQELAALGMDLTPRATPTPISVSPQGEAALQGDSRSSFQAEEQALDERAKKLYPKNQQAREDWKVAERSRALGYEARVQALAEASNSRKRARGVPVQTERSAPMRDVEATSELSVVRRSLPDGSTSYFYWTKPEVALVVKPSDKTEARTIVSIADQAQPALLKAALADGPIEAGPKTLGRGVVQQVSGVATDRFGVTRLIGREETRGKLQAETNRLAAKSASASAARLFAGQPEMDIATQAIAIDPKRAVTALRQKDAALVLPALRQITGDSNGPSGVPGGLAGGLGTEASADTTGSLADPGSASAVPTEFGNANADGAQPAGRGDMAVRDAGGSAAAVALYQNYSDEDFTGLITDTARTAVQAGHMSREEFFATTKAAREGNRAAALKNLSRADQRRGAVDNAGDGDSGVDPDARLDAEPSGKFDAMLGEPTELTSRSNSNRYQALEGPDAQLATRLLGNVIASGVPQGWLSGITRIFGIGPEAAGSHGQMSYVTSIGGKSVSAIGIRNTAFDSALPDANDTEAKWKQAVGRMTHEIAHGIDRIMGTDGFASSASPRLDITTESGILTGIGDMAKELVAAYDGGKDSSALGSLLKYPLAPSVRVKKSPEIIKAEMFAQSVRAYFTNKAELQSLAPKTYEAIDAIYQSSREPGSTRDTAHAAVRATLQAGQSGGLRGDSAQTVAEPAGGVAVNGPDTGSTGAQPGLPGRSGEDRQQQQRDGVVNEQAQSEPSGSAAAPGLSDGRPVRGGQGLLEQPRRADEGNAGRDPDGSLNGLPRQVGSIFASAWKSAAEVARKYMEGRGETYSPPDSYAKVDPKRAARIAEAYSAMEHEPQNPEVKAAYAAMIAETTAQYQAVIDSGLKVEFITGTDPYEGNPRLMTEDVKNNNHMWVFSTRDGFGSNVQFDPADNPLLNKTNFKIGDQPALVNDLFRVVHDYFGHVKEGVGFRAEGEENAWRAHAAMYSPQARRAMTTETRGQNSWVNYGPYGEHNRKASAADTIYADQKIGLLPEWVSSEGSGQEESATGLDVGAKSAVKVVSLEQYLYNDKLVLTPKFRDQAELAGYLDRKAQDALGRSLVGDYSAEALKHVGTVLANEGELALKNSGNAAQWYRDSINGAMDNAARLYPEIGTDPDHRFMFSVALAVTSNGSAMDANTRLGFEGYEAWRATGKLPSKLTGAGERSKAMLEAFANVNTMIEKAGSVAVVREFMLSKWPVREIKAKMLTIGVKVSSAENADTMVYGGYVLGPKIGAAFLPNMNGRHDVLTADRWFSRTFNRIIGGMLGTDGKTQDTPRSGAERQFMRDTIAKGLAILRRRGYDMEAADLQALLWYPEKELFAQMGVSDKRAAPTDYEQETRKFVEARLQQGKPDRPSGRTKPGGRRGNVDGAVNPAPAGDQVALFDDGPAVSRKGRLARELAQTDQRLADGQGRNDDTGNPLQEALSADAGRDVQVQLYSPEPGSAAAKLADDASKRLGTRIVYFLSKDSAAPGGAYVSSDPGTLYINGQTTEAEFVLGHEFLHSLRRAYPDLYDKLVGTLRTYSQNTLANRTEIEASYAEGGLDSIPDDLIEEENMADVAGAAFADGRFWNDFDKAMKGEPVGTVKQFFRWIARWFTKHFDKVDLNSDLGRAADLMRQDVAEAYADMARVNAAVSSLAADLALSVRRSGERKIPQTETASFKAWFGDSKVVDKAGKPLVVYHGTNSDFSEFSLDKAARGAEGKGFYFAVNPREASDFAVENGANVMPVYVSLTNPYVANIGARTPGAEKLSTQGYDGIIFNGVEKPGIFRVIAFKPNQIKSATGNNSNFDTTNPSILRSSGTAASPGKLTTASKIGVTASKAAAPVTATAQAANSTIDKMGAELARLTGATKLGQKAVSLIEKAIDAKTSWDWVERAKQGLVSNYGLPEEYLTAKISKQAAENKLLRQTQHTLDRLSAMNPDQLAVAYQWLQESPDSQREQALLAKLPAEQQAVMQQVKGDIDKLSQEAVKLGLISQETYDRNKMAYVHRSYKKYEAELTGSQVVTRQRATRLKGDQFKGRGMELEASLDRVSGELPDDLKGMKLEMLEKRDADGKLVRREYVVQGQARPAAMSGYTSAGTWEVRDATRGGKLKVWRDFTLAERQRMGEIEDARYGFARTMLQGIRDVETARFLGWTGDNYAKEEASGLDVVEIKFNRPQVFTRDEWVRVPDTVIKGTSVKRYGKLAGQYVPGVMWNDLQGTLELQDGIWDKLMSAWKISKTALSPAVHVNNVMSNFIMADIADVGVNDIRQALETIIRSKGGDAQAKALIERYEDSGAESGSFAANEIKTSVLEPLLKQIAASEPDAVQRASLANVIALAAHGQVREALSATTKTLPGRAVGATVDAMIKAYQSEDSVFRLAKFVNEINAGKSDLDAGKAAREAFLDYNINAPWIRAARRGPLPFLSFTYRAVPLLLKAAATKPWKFAKYAALGQGLSMLAYGMLGGAGDEEKEKRVMPEELQGTMLGLPKMIRMPWNDSDKDPMWLDVRRWLPAGDVTETNQSKAAAPLPSWLSIGGPLSLLIDFASNTDYRGNKIVQGTDTAGETIQKIADMVLKFALPNLPAPGLGALLRSVGAPVDTGTLDPYSWIAIEKAMDGAKNKTGKESDLGVALSASVGVKVQSRRIADELAAIDQKAKAKEREIRTDLTRIANLGARGEIDKSEMQRRLKREVDKLIELGQKTGEKLTPAK